MHQQRSQAAELFMLKLQFKDQRSEPIWVVDKSFAIGSADDNQLVINDSSVNLQHARIVRNDVHYSLRDLGSGEGVYVNNQRINKKPLINGDVIRVGRVELVVIDPFVDGNQTDWSLIACSSWLSGQEFKIPTNASEDGIKIGRSSHCDIIFPGTHLSREHIQLRISGDHLEVRDLGSANGTFINDLRINEGLLYPGDKLRLDVYSFKVFGPGLKSVNSAINADRQMPEPRLTRPPNIDWHDDATSSDEPRNWKTRPTSPGNRNGGTKTPNKHVGLIVIAAVLCVAVVGLGLYLFWG